MRRYEVWTLAVIILILVSPCLAQSGKDKLVGTWRLVAIEDPSPSKLFPDFNSIGYIMYDSTGHLSMQIIRRSDRPKFASGNRAEGTQEDVRTAFLGYGAYFGTYEVNEKEGIVIHHLEGALFPNDVGKDEIRYYEFSSNDRIILYVTRIVDGKLVPKSSCPRRLIWERGAGKMNVLPS
jgi:hypothetical protein